MKTFDVVSLGEALVDFLPERPGQAVRDVPRWVRCLGGAPANVAVGVSRLGGRSAMAGVTGDDEFGHFIASELRREGVDTSALRHTKNGKTGLGFVSLTTTGERSFIFYRLKAAEYLLDRSALDLNLLARSTVLHCGTNSLLTPQARLASLTAARLAKKAGRLVSCDPNLRLHLWRDTSVLQKLIRSLIPLCSILKLSDEEVGFVTGTTNVARALRTLETWGATVAIVTRGAAGATLRSRGKTISVPAPKVKVLDTTGAGDGFMAGFLYTLTRTVKTRADLATIELNTLEHCARIGCIAGSQVVTKLGAIAGLPYSVRGG